MSIENIWMKKVERINGQIRANKSKCGQQGKQNFSEELKKACRNRSENAEPENTPGFIPSELIIRRV